MKWLFNQRVGCLFVLVIVVVASTGLIYRLVSNPKIIAQDLADMSPPTATLPPLATATTGPTPGITPGLAQQPCSAKQRNFEMGVAFPQWTQEGYGGGDNEWLAGLPQMRKQTASCWVEMPLLLYQSTADATVITGGQSTPSVSAFTYGIQLAHAEGLHVFVTMLLQVGGSQPWAGGIKFSTVAQEQQWFNGYWAGIQPYVQAAAQAGAEQLAFATEEEWLQENAPSALWDSLISNVHSIFSGTLTYDLNWTSLQQTPPAWMSNTNLAMVGVSAYLPQIDRPQRLNLQQMTSLWQTSALPQLDTFAAKLGRAIFISEIGYRDSADALYQTWVSTSSAPTDQEEQADACSAALTSLQSDTQIAGIFFWGWSEVGAFNLADTQAAQVIHTQYQSWQM